MPVIYFYSFLNFKEYLFAFVEFKSKWAGAKRLLPWYYTKSSTLLYKSRSLYVFCLKRVPLLRSSFLYFGIIGNPSISQSPRSPPQFISLPPRSTVLSLLAVQPSPTQQFTSLPPSSPALSHPAAQPPSTSLLTSSTALSHLGAHLSPTRQSCFLPSNSHALKSKIFYFSHAKQYYSMMICWAGPVWTSLSCHRRCA